jgi:MFS family permease
MHSPPSSSSAVPAVSPFSVKNVRLFIAFRVFFNCRFYYPIFTVLFLDFGLSVAQFSMLNAVWAATIVLAEVPSGALADIVGRRRLLVFAAVSMLVEMAILCLAPRGNPTLLFGAFFINRVLSGLAEAAASGADEAIAYDSLQARGLADQWGRVLDVQMRLRSVMFILTMMVGAAVYDPELMNRVAAFVGSAVRFTQADTLRFPLYLTFGLAVLTLISVLRLEEGCDRPAADDTCGTAFGGSAMDAFKLTLNTGSWILKTPFVLAVILFGMLFDGILRMVITLASQYYRLVQLPESVFGILGSVMAVLGLFIPRLALWIAENRSPAFCLWSTAITAVAGLTGMCGFWPYVGLVPALVAFSALYMVGFYVSYFVNQRAPSARRATVLSFKGLAYNLSYGLIGILYAGLLEMEKGALDTSPGRSLSVENAVFQASFFWFPLFLAAGLMVLGAAVLAYRIRQR